jgi:hypothetical protein
VSLPPAVIAACEYRPRARPGDARRVARAQLPHVLRRTSRLVARRRHSAGGARLRRARDRRLAERVGIGPRGAGAADGDPAARRRRGRGSGLATPRDDRRRPRAHRQPGPDGGTRARRRGGGLDAGRARSGRWRRDGVLRTRVHRTGADDGRLGTTAAGKRPTRPVAGRRLDSRSGDRRGSGGDRGPGCRACGGRSDLRSQCGLPGSRPTGALRARVGGAFRP